MNLELQQALIDLVREVQGLIADLRGQLKEKGL